MSKTNPQTVHEAHLASFTGRLNMVAAAAHCGLTLREFKMTFREFLKYNPPQEWGISITQLDLF
jgi:hypothetical protein